MHIDILGAESLGVRGLSCVVETRDRKIVIDPGLALGLERHGLLPHPAQVAVGEQVRRRIIAGLEDATDVVMSHFHGAHIPLPDANLYQLQAQRVAPLCLTARPWAKGTEGLSPSMVRQRAVLGEMLGREIPNAEGQGNGMLALSPAMPYGKPRSQFGTVMMTRMPQCQARSRRPSSSQSSSMLMADKEPKVSQSPETTKVKTTRLHNAGNVKWIQSSCQRLSSL